MNGATSGQHESHFSGGARALGAGSRLAALRRLAAVPLWSALACGGGGGGAGKSGSNGQVLVAVQTNAGGANYRLQNATLTGAGAEAFTLESDEATQVSMSRSLAPGAYTLKLEDGWVLARQAAGTFMAVTATLSSANPVSFNVAAAQIARVGFTFDAAGVSVNLVPAADEGNDDNE